MIIKELVTCKLEYQIHSLRIRMIDTGQSKGLNHPDTVKYSQQLDNHILIYQKMILPTKAN